jgi:dephospho-CoA kinase
LLVIGLTGGIASGKSEAAARFVALGVPVLDADRIARELVAPGQPLLAEIYTTFGTDLRLPDGSLDRAALGRRVFADPGERRRLEALLHPKIRDEMVRRLAQLDAPYAILVAPLLVESGMTDMVDRVLVIDVPESLQRTRSQQRDGHDAQHVERILAAQADRQTRLELADDVIVNTGDLGELESAIRQLHQRYLALASQA